jgi:hypothetical protein
MQKNKVSEQDKIEYKKYLLRYIFLNVEDIIDTKLLTLEEFVARKELK